MRRWLSVLPVLLVCLGCCVKPCVAPPPVTPHKFGDVSTGDGSQPTWVTNIPTLVGQASSTIVEFDTTRGDTILKQFPFLQRIMVTGQCDQTVTIVYQVKLTPDTTWVTAAGSNASTSYPASTTTETDFLVQGPESRIQAITTTAPTVCKLAIALFNARILGQ